MLALPPLPSLAPRPGDWLFEEVDARDLVVLAGEEQGVLAGAAAHVEDGAGDPVSHIEERLLRIADVPGGLPGVGGLLTSPLPPAE